jgi:hypothetical protein
LTRQELSEASCLLDLMKDRLDDLPAQSATATSHFQHQMMDRLIELETGKPAAMRFSRPAGGDSGLVRTRFEPSTIYAGRASSFRNFCCGADSTVCRGTLFSLTRIIHRAT